MYERENEFTLESYYDLIIFGSYKLKQKCWIFVVYNNWIILKELCFLNSEPYTENQTVHGSEEILVISCKISLWYFFLRPVS